MKNTKNIEKFGQILMAKNYSRHTAVTYMACIKNLSVFFSEDTTRISQKDIQSFLVDRVMKNNYSFSDQNQHINAIKLYYFFVYGIKIKPKYVQRPRKSRKLPKVLTVDEVQRIINAPQNLKHKAILLTIYALGLRISELTNIKITDIDGTNMRVFVRNGKGKKDRICKLTPELLQTFRKYYKQYHPVEYLFNGQSKTSAKYSTTSIENIFKRAKYQANIFKPATVHTLRHSFATHLLEQGNSLRAIQYLMGHKNSKTTEIYTHITNTAIDAVINPKLKIAI